MPKEPISKHRIPLGLPAKEQKQVYKTLFKSVRSKVLQNLLMLWYNIYQKKSKLGKRLRRRLRRKGYPISMDRLVRELTIEDVMGVISVSPRTAREYRDALQVMM